MDLYWYRYLQSIWALSVSVSWTNGKKGQRQPCTTHLKFYVSKFCFWWFQSVWMFNEANNRIHSRLLHLKFMDILLHDKSTRKELKELLSYQIVNLGLMFFMIFFSSFVQLTGDKQYLQRNKSSMSNYNLNFQLKLASSSGWAVLCCMDSSISVTVHQSRNLLKLAPLSPSISPYLHMYWTSMGMESSIACLWSTEKEEAVDILYIRFLYKTWL